VVVVDVVVVVVAAAAAAVFVVAAAVVCTNLVSYNLYWNVAGSSVRRYRRLDSKKNKDEFPSSKIDSILSDA
jgi:hypothetical protein